MTYECDRCDGRGKISAFSHVIGGTCFKCGGSGRLEKKPAARSIKFAVFGLDRESGKHMRLYNETAKTSAKAVARARITFERASQSFRDRYSMKDPVAIRVDEIGDALELPADAGA